MITISFFIKIQRHKLKDYKTSERDCYNFEECVECKKYANEGQQVIIHSLERRRDIKREREGEIYKEDDETHPIHFLVGLGYCQAERAIRSTPSGWLLTTIKHIVFPSFFAWIYQNKTPNLIFRKKDRDMKKMGIDMLVVMIFERRLGSG